MPIDTRHNTEPPHHTVGRAVLPNAPMSFPMPPVGGSGVSLSPQNSFWLAAAELCRALTKLAEKATEELSKGDKG